MSSKNLTIHEPQAPTALRGEAEALIAQAIDKNVPVETMEKLLAMRRELRAEKAKEEYDKAMAAFQADCPVIEKKKAVFEKGSTTVARYKYAPLDDIVSQVKATLSKHGLSYSMNVEQDDKMLGVICKVTHQAGHSEVSGFKVPIGAEAYMSDVQKYGARLTFAKRYAFCNAFGILTGDEDTDGNTPSEPKPAPAPYKAPAEVAKKLHLNEEAPVAPKEPEKPKAPEMVTNDQKVEIMTMMGKKGITFDDLVKPFEYLNNRDKTKVEKVQELTEKQANDLIRWMAKKESKTSPLPAEAEINMDEADEAIQQSMLEKEKKHASLTEPI